MRTYLFSLLAFIAISCATAPAYADMPFYDDDEEFEHCTKVYDWDDCVREETQRDLNIVKRQYKTILSDPLILKWNPKPEDNTAILRDMYESWTAFRNRLCSLSNKATMYLERLVNEKYACNLYYVKHHQDHLDRILELMTKQIPAERKEFDFLKITSHDEEYAKCMKEPAKRICIAEELKRSSQQIKNLYKTFSEDEFVGKWNNGPDLKQGNYRDMYDSWIAYRNRICSLAVWAYHNAYGEKSITSDECLQYFNREKLETMENLLYSAHSSLDIDIEDGEGVDDVPHDDTIDLSQYEMPKDDGGEAEGKTITPLKRRIDAIGTSDDSLTEKEPEVEPSEAKEPKPEKSNKNIPAWAQ